jgi:hypothetical protein
MSPFGNQVLTMQWSGALRDLLVLGIRLIRALICSVANTLSIEPSV